MTNERYLIVSYFLVAALSAGLGVLVYLFLRRPFSTVADAASNKRLPSLLKRLLPCGFIFPALLGFVSVSYRGCNKTYKQIVESRSYLIQKNQDQISSALLFILAAILFWDLIVLLTLKYAQNRGVGSQSPQR